MTVYINIFSLQAGILYKYEALRAVHTCTNVSIRSTIQSVHHLQKATG